MTNSFTVWLEDSLKVLDGMYYNITIDFLLVGHEHCVQLEIEKSNADGTKIPCVEKILLTKERFDELYSSYATLMSITQKTVE